MSDVTIEEICKAAEIVNRLIRSPHIETPDQGNTLISADILLRKILSKAESEQAAERRVEELAEALFRVDYPKSVWPSTVSRGVYRKLARAAIEFLS